MNRKRMIEVLKLASEYWEALAEAADSEGISDTAEDFEAREDLREVIRALEKGNE